MTQKSFESRTLSNPELKLFMEENLHHPIYKWPIKKWNFNNLYLAAMFYHPDLDVVRTKWASTTSAEITAGEKPNPTIGITPQYDFNAADGVSPWTMGLNFDIPIETAGKRGYRVQQSKLQSESARLNIASVGWQVRSRLRSKLLDYYIAQESLKVFNKQISIQEEYLGLLEKRLKAGLIAQPEVTRVRVSLTQTRLQVQDFQKQSEEAKAEIADAIGIPLKSLNDISLDASFLEQYPIQPAYKKIYGEGLKNRTDLISALTEYSASESALQLEIAKQYPDLHLGPGYSWDQGENKWSLGFNFTLPVFNKNEGTIREAESKRKELAESFKALQAKIIGEIELASVSYQQSLKQLDAVDNLKSVQENQSKAVQALFDAGLEDRLSLVSNHLELVSIEFTRLDTLKKIQQSLASLEDAVQKPLVKSELRMASLEENPREPKGEQK